MNNMQNKTKKIYMLMCVFIGIFLILWFTCPRFAQEHELDFLKSHNKYWEDFQRQKTEESKNYRFIAFQVDSNNDGIIQKTIEVNDRKVNIRRDDNTVLVSNDIYITVVAYVEGDYAKYWEVSMESINGQYYPINKYTDPCQIPDDEWQYFEVNPGGWDSLKRIFIWDTSPADKLDTIYPITVSTDDYVKEVGYETWTIKTSEMPLFKEKKVDLPFVQVETFFKNGVAEKEVMYNDMDFNGEFTDDEYVTIRIQDMYGEVDLDKVETDEYSINLSKIRP